MTVARKVWKRVVAVLLVVVGCVLLLHGALVLSFLAFAPSKRTNPRGELAPPSSGAVTVVALADVHARPVVLSEAFDSVRTLGGDAILHGGDLANQNSEFEYRYSLSLLTNAPPVAVFLAIGNHEGWDRESNLSRERFERVFGPPVSWFAIKGILVVSIDTSDERTFPEDQAQVVDAILTKQRPKANHVVVLTHVMPRFEKPSIDKRGYVKHLFLADSERLRKLCEKHRVGLVLGGHFHGYSTEKRGGTLFVMSGGGGGSLDGRTEVYHYLRLTFDGHGITHEVIRVPSPFGPEWLRYLDLKYRWSVLGGLAVAFAVCIFSAQRLRSPNLPDMSRATLDAPV